ncbi:MAG TPA: hypothetical protein H9731_00050 [Candidatus Borkfalkia excrementipullorum]|nr:hypothetical protein [Candidatus Borkfalkia excrementipullorum]
MTFLMYEYGMQIGEELRRAYLEEQERRKREEARREEERFRGLRKRVRESGVGAEEYMLLPFRFGNRLWLKTERYSSVLLALSVRRNSCSTKTRAGKRQTAWKKRRQRHRHRRAAGLRRKAKRRSLYPQKGRKRGSTD